MEVDNKRYYSSQEISLGSSSITVESNPVLGIDVSERLEDPDHFVGPKNYPHIVNFGQTFVDRKMRGQHVDPKDQWSADNPPPEGISVLEFHNTEVRKWIKSISEIAETDFYEDEQKCGEYYDLTAQVFAEISKEAMARGLLTSGDKPAFLGLVRAGAVAGEILGFKIGDGINNELSDQVLIQTKRLHVKGQKEGDISIGIDYLNPGKLADLKNKPWIIADPAGATYASVVANIAVLKSRGIVPSKVLIFNVVGSQRGAEFALEAIRSMGIEVNIIVGGSSPGMNESYYLETADRKPCVKDAGEALNGSLPEPLQLKKPA